MVKQSAADFAEPCVARTASHPSPQTVGNTRSGDGGCHSTEQHRHEIIGQ